jgi:group I intron endonuclease
MIGIELMPDSPGVYMITSPTGNVYIGESISIKNRAKYYLTPSRIKRQTAIYNSLVKHGVENHTIEVLEICDVSILKQRERFYQDKYNSVHGGLNCKLTPTTEKKGVFSSDTRAKMSEKANGEGNPFFGKKHSAESLEKISRASSGKNNPNYGSKFKSEEYIKKQSDSNSKVPIKLVNSYTQEVHEFKNSKEAALFCGANPSNVRTCKISGHKVKRIYFVL